MKKIWLCLIMSVNCYADIGTITEQVNKPPQIERSKQSLTGSKGTGVEMNDVVKTAAGKVKITFQDDTKVEVNENSKLVIDDFVYDAKSSKGGKLAVKVALGTVRYASGQIAKNNPQAVAINTPTATVAVRGTDFTMTVDEQRGIVYMPLGGPSANFWGGDRKGNNLFGNSVVALDAMTGKLKWYFQTIHHDVWDYDLPPAPGLVNIKQNGKTIPALAQVGKMGYMFILDRITGKPVFGVDETPVPKSEVPGEEASPTQPIPTKPAPYSQLGLMEADLIDYTPAIKDSALKIAKLCRMGPYFIPGSPADGKGKNGPAEYKCSWYAPGASGGVNIDGGSAVDPETGMMFVGAQTGLTVSPLLCFGTEAQKQKYLPKILSGEWVGAYCLSEPIVSPERRQIGRAHV